MYLIKSRLCIVIGQYAYTVRECCIDLLEMASLYILFNEMWLWKQLLSIPFDIYPQSSPRLDAPEAIRANS